jgi:uncharacterized delta-60 repeat protein
MKKLYSLLLLTVFGILTSYSQTIDETFIEPIPYKAAKITVTKELFDGKILIGGAIKFYKDKEVGNLIRLNADYSLDETFLFNDPNKLYIKKVQVRSNGDIIVLASVANLYNQAFEKATIFQLNADGEIKAQITGLEDITSIAIQDDNKVLISSGTMAIDRGYVRRYNSDLTIDKTFKQDVLFDKKVNDIKVFGSAIYASGLFSTVNGIVKNGIVKLNSDGTVDTTFDIGDEITKNIEFSIALQEDGKILIGGNFKRVVNNVPSYNICRLNLDGSLDKTFLSQYYSYPNSGIVVKDSYIYMATWINDVIVPGAYVVKLNSNGTLNKKFTPIKLNEFGMNDFTANFVGDKLFYNNSEYTGNRYGLSICDLEGNSVDSSELKPSQIGNFEGGGYFDGKLVVKGDFVKVNEVETFGIALLDEKGSVDKSFVFPKYLGDIKQFQIIDNTTIFVSTKNSFVKLDNKGNVLKEFKFKEDSKLLAIEQFKVLNNDKILITDQWGLYLLNEEGKQEIEYKLNTNPYYWNTGINFELQDDKIICKAQFETNTAGYKSRSKVMRFNLDGSIDPDFNISDSEPGIGKIKVLDSGEIIVAGSFVNFNGISVPNQLLKLSKDGIADLKFIENLEIPKIGISGGKYYDYRKIEEIDSIIYITQGDSNITALYLDGMPKFDFEMPVVIDNINDIIPLKEIVEETSETSETSRKSKSVTDGNFMFAIGTKNNLTGVSSVIVKINLEGKMLSVDPIPEKSISNVQIYPIPVKEKINLSFSNSIKPTKISVYSASGTELYSSVIKSSEEIEVDMSRFNSGVYFIKVFSNSGITTKKVIKN